MRARGVLAAAATTAALMVSVPAASACAGGHLGVAWTGFQDPISDFGPVFFYHSVEPTTSVNVPIAIRGLGDDCTNPPQPVVATYRVSAPPTGTPRAATSGLDYSPILPERTTGPLYGYHAQGPTQHQDSVPVQGDALVEPVAELAQAVITGSSGRRDPPFDVPFYVLDDDGTERASFESAGPYERSETYGTISVPIFRGGAAALAASYEVTAAPSGASPATQGQDFVLPTSTVTFESGRRVALFEVRILDEGLAEGSEELKLTLSQPGAVLPDDPVTTSVRILDSLSSAGLESRLHHPRNRFRYRADDYRIREIHIFTESTGGLPVSAAEFALRRNSENEKCSWWTGNRFKRGSCDGERWLKTGVYEPDFFFFRLRELAPSTGRIKSYTAFSRAMNGTSQVEAALDRGRNYNTFEVKPPK